MTSSPPCGLDRLSCGIGAITRTRMVRTGKPGGEVGTTYIVTLPTVNAILGAVSIRFAEHDGRGLLLSRSPKLLCCVRRENRFTHGVQDDVVSRNGRGYGRDARRH